MGSDKMKHDFVELYNELQKKKEFYAEDVDSKLLKYIPVENKDEVIMYIYKIDGGGFTGWYTPALSHITHQILNKQLKLIDEELLQETIEWIKIK